MITGLLIFYGITVVIAWLVFAFLAEMSTLVGLSNTRISDYVKVTVAALIWPLVLLVNILRVIVKKVL